MAVLALGGREPSVFSHVLFGFALFIAALRQEERSMAWHYIAPGKPMDRGACVDGPRSTRVFA